MAMKIKKGDTVQIIAGNHKGATGRVLQVDPVHGRVIVQGQNLTKKHVKPSRKNPQGGRVNVEQPIHISNCLPVNPASSKGSRVGFKIGSDGGKKRVAADGTEISVVKKGKK